MKDILFAGHRILTSNEIADAVIQYAAALVASAGADVVTFPAFNDGEPVECSLVIGCGAQIAAVTVPETYPSELRGADEACVAIDTQYAALRQGAAS
jgi:hypothetical protein